MSSSASTNSLIGIGVASAVLLIGLSYTITRGLTSDGKNEDSQKAPNSFRAHTYDSRSKYS